MVRKSITRPLFITKREKENINKQKYSGRSKSPPTQPQPTILLNDNKFSAAKLLTVLLLLLWLLIKARLVLGQGSGRQEKSPQ